MCDSCGLVLPAVTCSVTQSWQHRGGPWLLQQGVGFNTHRDLSLEFGGLSKLVFEAGIVALLVCDFCRCLSGQVCVTNLCI